MSQRIFARCVTAEKVTFSPANFTFPRNFVKSAPSWSGCAQLQSEQNRVSSDLAILDFSCSVVQKHFRHQKINISTTFCSQSFKSVLQFASFEIFAQCDLRSTG
jgi:hypothetical protein